MLVALDFGRAFAAARVTRDGMIQLVSVSEGGRELAGVCELATKTSSSLLRLRVSSSALLSQRGESVSAGVLAREVTSDFPACRRVNDRL